MCDRRKTDARLSWLKLAPGATEVPLSSHGSSSHKWRVGGWVGGLCLKLKEVGMDGKSTLKMFTRKKRELIKTPSITKRSRAGSPGPQSSAPALSILQEQPRKDAVDGALSSSPSASTLSPNTAGLLDPSTSCPGAPSVGRIQGMSSPVGTLRRPTSLSRHASAAEGKTLLVQMDLEQYITRVGSHPTTSTPRPGDELVLRNGRSSLSRAACFPLQSWVFTRGQGKGALTPTAPVDSPESTALDVEDIPALLRDVARFAEAVEKLKDVVMVEGEESQRPVAHECLGEVLRVLRQVINTYPLLNTVEILTAAGKLISKVKGFHYEAPNEAGKMDFEKAIETIAVAFSSNVSELLMGEVDSSTLLSLLPTEKSRSMENLCAAAGPDGSQFRGELRDLGRVEEVDVILQHSEGGVDSALLYAKTVSKYMKDLISYVEKRTSLEMEFSKGLQKLYQSCKHSITHPHMPLFSIYSLALEQDQEQSVGLQQANTTLHSQTFVQPLVQRKQEHEKKRKDIKDQWIRAKRKLMECEVNLKKAKQSYLVRCEEHEKAKAAASRAEEEGAGSTAKTVEKKKRLEDEAHNKADEAEATYRTCIADAKTQRLDLDHTKVTVLRQLQDVIKQSDQTLRSATISYYQLMHMQTVALPVHYQTLCESSKLYDPGQQYAAHVKDLQLPEQPPVMYTFEAYSPSSSHQGHRPRNDSFNTEPPSHSESPATLQDREAEAQRKRQGHKSWSSTVSDDSVGGEGLDSPTASTSDISKIPRTSSTCTVSSNEDADEKDGNVASFEAPNINCMDPDVVVSTRQFRNIGLSKAAQTHRLRKLRTPSKCRECDSYVYFQGAECEECFLSCHKRCLETLAIQCGHKKLQGRLQLFGRDFSQVANCASDGIPFIITKCISEIERRALKMKGIYRVNGVKTRVEKLCQAFENGKELVELSQCSPHDISNVLKLYLRQLPEPILPFHLYHHLMGLAKESMHSDSEEESCGPAVGKGPELVDLGPDTNPEILKLIEKLKGLLKQLPKANIATLSYITRHLRRISELEDDNKMSPSNLGIVFGPSLMRPRPTGATISLSSLVDYPHQARIVEALIVFYSSIFQSKLNKYGRSASISVEPSTVDEKNVNSHDEENLMEEEQIIEVKTEDGCSSSLRSLGSNEQLSDSEEEAQVTLSRTLVKQECEASLDEDQLSLQNSLDISSVSASYTDAESEKDKSICEEAPTPPNCSPPEEAPDEGVVTSLGNLNLNQNNNYPCSPVKTLSGFPLSRAPKKLPLTRNRDSEPEFV